MILFASVECLFYHCRSLKDKRALLQRMIARLRQKFNVSVSEIEYQDAWQRTKIGIALVASAKKPAEQEMQRVLQIIDSFPELERTVTNLEWL
ncbi:MAG: DUF503 domain-containing protein [Caldibacillus debilis]|jgi:uncharacterized protein YlxP (DUF503 family)|uniref:YlxP-like protein n=2 Tax=Caldibacillus debilis TaxID=301148 RepID=A0A420VBD8_9BACI|nr:DUF503 family protein [Caldibacillus debilis]MBO2480376.1 DUF503 domain-containing protein [Bacillaceae bacterium]KYD09378.1 hypothetical protein B4135_3702 [Caldibacillus debilis]MBY6271269.1 DUF503 domain-containing protein [Bacillaceae bacterium]OUM83663.1 MAG: hypothetical protein BAA03_14980 [Caldibacillus debilis]REJ20023.1 MAG: DUF503 domain-containing protein [Caldibacillus debilis]